MDGWHSHGVLSAVPWGALVMSVPATPVSAVTGSTAPLLSAVGSSAWNPNTSLCSPAMLSTMLPSLLAGAAGGRCGSWCGRWDSGVHLDTCAYLSTVSTVLPGHYTSVFACSGHAWDLVWLVL